MTSFSESLQAVVALFEGPLAGVRFADVDAAGLSKLAAELTRATADVEQQEAKLVELRQGLAQRQETLLSLAQQGLAYARIYAEGDDQLLAKLEDMALPRAAKPRKGSKPRTSAEDAAAVGAAAPESEPAAAAAGDASLAGIADDGAEESDVLPGKAKLTRSKVKRRLGRAAAHEEAR